MLLAETTNWVSTWTHPSLHDIVGTTMSLDHLVAETANEIVSGLLVYPLVRLAVKRHDRRKHGLPTDSHHQ